MNSLYVVLDKYGPRNLGNAIGRGFAAPTVSNVNASFPVANLCDGRADIVYMVASATANAYIQQDLNVVGDPTVEFPISSGLLGPSWVVDSALIAHQDIPMRAGELARFVCGMSGNGSAASTVTVRNQANGHYLASGGAWQAAPAFAASQIGGLTGFQFNFTMEDILTCNDQTAPLLRVTLTVPDGTPQSHFAGGGVVMYPGVNFAAVYGHNVAGVTPVVQYSTDNFSWVTISDATFAPRQPGFFGVTVISPLTLNLAARYYRLLLSGTNTAPLFFGEFVLGQSTAPVRAQRWDWHEKDTWPQIRQKNDAGQTWAYAITDARMRGLELQFTPYDATADADSMLALESIRKDMWMRSKGGVYPIVLVPRSQRGDLTFGRISEVPLDVVQALPNQEQLSIGIDPFPPPIVGP